MKLLETGKIVTTHGIKGEVRVEAWSNSLDDLLEIDIFFKADGTELHVEHSRIHRGAVNLKLMGYDGIDKAMELIGAILYLDCEDVELEEGVYFIKDLMGLSVVDATTGECYGSIVHVQATGANDVYHVQSGDRLLLVPAIAQVVQRVDLKSRRMLITPMKGLFD